MLFILYTLIAAMFHPYVIVNVFEKFIVHSTASIIMTTGIVNAVFFV